MTLTAGIDVGTGVVKAAIFRVEGDREEWLSKCNLRIRSRDPMQLAREAFDQALADAVVKEEDIDYVATTGEGEAIPFHTGHFYSMTSHARGARFLNPATRAILDSGALHGRAMITDDKGKVINYKMTSQCASGSGQFLENIARYLGIAQDEIGALSVKGDDPEEVSSICAVLAETDVINMVSRGITAPNILKGIHLSMASRLARLLKSIGVKGDVIMMTGGMGLDEGLCQALRESLAKMKGMEDSQVVNHVDSIYAGAIGAALWGAFRHRKLAASGQLLKAS
ncbi:MAG: benzoyl-CoA reductase subunit D [Antarcticimicrobium sp.]|uniref:benzoyl-CoA reductase subunit D n=1 Tax=Antarcticimicrobium sp. TaxID=2824147 RepID=UPI002615CC49|nr:benzoyl-CoA reductase subunit D [Antarcticimicrobium sp.]MDF1717749.1 benzoyl-CoA reductase subunit D [Antarcticimicrobium sp.]